MKFLTRVSLSLFSRSLFPLSLTRFGSCRAVAAAALPALLPALLLAGAGAAQAQAPPSLPAGANASLQASLAKNDPALHPQATADGFVAHDRSGSLQTSFRAAGVEVRGSGSGNHLKLQFAGWGRGAALQQITALQQIPARPAIDGNRIEYRRDGLTEWYVNQPGGVEQGFTLRTRPAAGCTGGVCPDVAVALTADSNLDPRVSADRRSLDMVDADGVVQLRYSDLAASDADGRSLPASIVAQGRSIELRVDDRGARYPITIDPYIQAVKLTNPGSASDYYGYSLAMDGSLMVVGAPDQVSGGTAAGAVYLYRIVNQSPTLLATLSPTTTNSASLLKFGSRVAIKNNIIVVGSGNSNSAYVFRLSGSTATQTAELTGATGSFFGFSVATDGTYVVVGAPHATVGTNLTQGLVYVYKVASTTSVVTNPVTPINVRFPINVRSPLFAAATPSTADLALDTVSGTDTGSPISGAHISAIASLSTITSGSGVTEMGNLSGTDAAAASLVGWYVGVSNNVIVASATGLTIGSNTTQGGAYLFQINGAALTQIAKLTNGAGAAADAMGYAAVIGGDIVAVSSQARNSNTGEVYVFNKPTAGWASTSTPSITITASDAMQYFYFGSSLAIDGTNLAVGSYNATVGTAQDAGEVYLFSLSGTTATQTSRLNAIDYKAIYSLGYAVAVQGNFLAAGVLNYKVAYLFTDVETKVDLVAAPTTATYGQTVQLTATVTANNGTPTGSLSFLNGTSTLASNVALSNGVASASVTLPAGTNSLTAAYPAQSSFAAGISNAVSEVVTPATLTVAADNKNFIYGGSVPPLTYTIAGLVNGDTAAAVYSGTPVLSTTATSASVPGPTYPILIAQGTLALLSSNYAFAFQGASLTITALNTVATPVITPVTGSYVGPQSVTITDATPGVTIFYTLDGTVPSLKSPVYTTSFVVKKPVTVKAIGVYTGYLRSTMAYSIINIH